ncbi:DinB family protein [Pseudonocardia sp.]|uniref:DinB family protein n=1 Tax=Pseudonocardia sp. TaxID=60912 RepID=UPI003D0DB39C
MEPTEIRAEMRRAQAEFEQMTRTANPQAMRRATNGTRWTNRQLLFHMVLGYGVVRTLLPLVRALGRLGHSTGFARVLDATRAPFHVVNYLGARCAGEVVSPRAMTLLLARLVNGLDRSLTTDADRGRLGLAMHFPTTWDPYFRSTMTVLDVYHFGTQHFDHHRRQLTLDG